MKQLLRFTKKQCFLALFTIGFSSIIHAETFRIEDIRVEGLQRVSASPAFAALPISAGDIVDAESIRMAIRSLFDTGFFNDIEVFNDNGVLIFKVKELPTISEITIDGNKAIKTEMLEDAMSKNGLGEGEIFQRGTLDVILNELERQYIAQGRYSASVTADIIDLPNNQIKVDVLVDEGKVAAIKHINIVGNTAFSDEELESLFEMTSTGWFSWITGDDKYAREKLKGDIETLESYYLDRGYLDFNIVSSQVSLSPDQRSVYITLNVSEGDIYTVNKIELAGDLIVPEARLRRLILLSEGNTFSQGLMTSTSEYITDLMGNAGYTNAEVEGIPTPNREDKTVEVTFLINPSQRVYVRRIEFKGNTRTQDEVLRREMRQMEGSSASNAKIDQGKVRLERLGFFKEVNVENKDVPGASDQIDIEYTVEEQPSASVNASLGYGQSTGAMIGASLNHNNWQGSGKQVGISVNHSTYQTAYNFSYVDPYFTPDGVSRGISLFYNSRDYSKINVSSYTTDSYGLNFSFGYPISEIQGLNFSFGYTHLSVKTGSNTVQEIRRTPFNIGEQYFIDNDILFYITDEELLTNGPSTEGGVFEDFSYESGLVTEDMLFDGKLGFVDRYGDEFDTLSMNASWRRNTLNRGMMATRGSKQSLSIEATVPGSDLEYYLLRYEGQIFKPLTRDLTLKFRTTLAYGDGYGDMERLPFFKNFLAGGFGSVRGFRRSSLGPQASPSLTYLKYDGGSAAIAPLDYTAIDTDGDGVNDSYAPSGAAYVLCSSDQSSPYCAPNNAGQLSTTYSGSAYSNRGFGGNLLVEFGAELLFPIPFLEDQRSMQLAMFIDAGNVFDTQCSATQAKCSDFDKDEIRSSIGLGLNWLSGMGPLTFSLSRPLKYNKEIDDREAFQFSLAAPF